MKRRPKKWQAAALNALRREHEKGRKAALLQLPPGQGKTLVAVRHFAWLMKRGYRLVVATPTRDERYYNIWGSHFGQDIGSAFRWFSTRGCIRADNRYRAAVVSHRELKEALEGNGHPILSGWLRKKRKLLIVIDELHRASALKNSLANAYWRGEGDGLPRRLREPSGNLRWLLLSATPYNPVKLDYDVDKPGHDFQGDIEAIQIEANQVADEVELTLGALAQLSGAPRDKSKLKRYTDAIRTTMSLDNGPCDTLAPPVAIVPKTSGSMQPLRPLECRVRQDKADVETSVFALADIHRKLAEHRDLSDRTATAERLVIGGVPRPRQGDKYLCGHEYSMATVHATRVAASSGRTGGFDVKMVALESLLRQLLRHKEEKVLIFCVHRAVATAVAKRLRKDMLFDSPQEVADATDYYGGRLIDRCKQFEKPQSRPRVLVTTDKLSESINLHGACECLVHFELPWSPLRVLQRVGRLWRIKSNSQRRHSRAPHVFHLIHPCSVEEEIVNRLRRRWGYLKVLGLDYMPIEYGLGMRVPQVRW